MMPPTERILSALSDRNCDPKRNGKGWSARCPAHEDRRPSLSVSEGDDGRALVRCHAGCTVESICDAVGLRLSDLMTDDQSTVSTSTQPREARKKRQYRRPAGEKPTSYKTANAAVSTLERKHGKRSALWTYYDANGVPLSVIVRWDTPAGKDIRPVSRNGDGWIIGGMPEPRPLYCLPDLGDADRVYITEGEKAADAAREIGLTATTSAHGSQSPGKTDWSPLAGKKCVILPDNDEPGRKYAEVVGAILAKLTTPAVVKVVELPELPEHADIVDWIDAHGDAAEPDELRQQIDALADAAEPLRPVSPQTPRPKTLAHSGKLGALCEEPTPVGPVLVRLSDVTPEKVRWLWSDRIALSKVALLAGDPGLGKSFVSLDITARVTRALPWPDGCENSVPPGGVVLLSAEDDPADTIRPRLDASGADVSRVNVLTAIEGADDDGQYRRGVDLTRDLRYVDQAIEETPDCRLVIIDPISAYLGRTDSHKNADVRGVLAPLAELASRHGVAVLAVTHLSKGEGPAIYRSIGSIAFVAAARTAWAIAADHSDPDRRLFLPIKNNLASSPPGMAYRIDTRPAVEWEADPVTVTADKALGRDADDGTKSALGEAVDWLSHSLANGRRPAKEVKDEANEAGVSLRTLDRAKAKLGVIAGPDGFGEPWMWRLPDAPTERQSAPNLTEYANKKGWRDCGETGAERDGEWGEL